MTEADGGVQAGWHHGPGGVAGFAVVDVDEIYFLELTPLDSGAIERSNAVCRQIGDFDAQVVAAVAQSVAAIKNKRSGPCGAKVVAVEVDSGTLAHVAQLYCPATFGQVAFVHIEMGCIDPGSGQCVEHTGRSRALDPEA